MGKPVIREFGNIEPGARGPLFEEERAPLVDVIANGEEVLVVTELPGLRRTRSRRKPVGQGMPSM